MYACVCLDSMHVWMGICVHTCTHMFLNMSNCVFIHVWELKPLVRGFGPQAQQKVFLPAR